MLTTSTDISSLTTALTTSSLSQQMLTLASSTLRLAASALRIKQQEHQQQLVDHLPEYNLEQVSWHDRPDDCWIVLNDRVYNVTKLIDSHPGGFEVIMEHAGRDATLAFRSVGHSIDAIEQVDEFLVGILPPNERIFQRRCK